MVGNRTSGITVFLLFLLGSSLSGGCSKSAATSTDLNFVCESDPTRHRVGLNTFTITLTASNGERLAAARIALGGDMSHPGMSPVFSEAKEITPGRNQGTLDLNMRGDWTVLFHITLPNGRSFDRQVDVRNLQAT
jgi:hypothetical protein